MWVVDGCLDLFDLQQLMYINHYLGCKGHILVCLEVLGDANMGEEEDQFPSDVLGRCFGIALGYREALLTVTRMYSWPWADFENESTTSMPAVSKGILMMGKGMSGA